MRKTDTQKEFRRQMREIEKESRDGAPTERYSYVEKDFVNDKNIRTRRRRRTIAISASGVLVTIFLLWYFYPMLSSLLGNLMRGFGYVPPEERAAYAAYVQQTDFCLEMLAAADEEAALAVRSGRMPDARRIRTSAAAAVQYYAGIYAPGRADSYHLKLGELLRSYDTLAEALNIDEVRERWETIRQARQKLENQRAGLARRGGIKE